MEIEADLEQLNIEDIQAIGDENDQNSVALNYVAENRELKISEKFGEFPKQLTIFSRGEDLILPDGIQWEKFGTFRWALECFVEDTWTLAIDYFDRTQDYGDVNRLVFKGNVHFLKSSLLTLGPRQPIPMTEFDEMFKYSSYQDLSWCNFSVRVQDNLHRCSLIGFDDHDFIPNRKEIYLNRKLDDVELTKLDAYVLSDAFQAELRIYEVVPGAWHAPEDSDIRKIYRFVSRGEYNYPPLEPNKQRPVWILLHDGASDSFYPICEFIDMPGYWYYFRPEHTASVVLCEGDDGGFPLIK